MKLLSPTVAGLLAWLAVAPAPARPADAPPPQVWAIVIGIDEYKDTPFGRCPGALRDARNVESWVAGAAGWGGQAVLRMDDNGPRRHGLATDRTRELLPTRENLDWAVTEWLGARVGEGDVVLIYFAGQAAALPPRSGEPAGRAYLLPIDAKAADIEHTGWSLDAALDRAATAKKARVVAWLDTSLQGRGATHRVPPPGAPSGADWLRALTRWPGVTAWLAADGRPAPDDGSFVAALASSLGTPEKPHNILGCLQDLRNDRALVDRGFRTEGGVEPGVTLWSAAGRVEKGIPRFLKRPEKPAPEQVIQSGHRAQVTSVLVTADNARMITASQDSTVRVWKLDDRESTLIRVLTDPLIGVRALAMDHDGRVLVAGDGEGKVISWDIIEDRPKPKDGPKAHDEPIQTLVFLPDSVTFVSLDEAGHSNLWEAKVGGIELLRPFSQDLLGEVVAATRPASGAPSMVASTRPDGSRPGAVLTYDSSGKRTGRVDGPGGSITALDLSGDGRRLAVGDDRGRVLVLELPARRVAYEGQFQGRITLARFSRSGLVAVADGRSLHLVEPRAGARPASLVDFGGKPAPGGIERARFSDDGRWLAACTGTVEGRALAWGLADPARPVAIEVPGDDGGAIVPAFSPDGRALILGDARGRVRAWRVDEAPGGGAQLVPRPGVPAARGQVGMLCPSPSGRYLLEVTRDGQALVWDLEKAKGCTPLPGRWTSGGFLADEAKLVMSAHPDDGGEVVLVDRTRPDLPPARFPRPVDADGKSLDASFGPVVVSKSGRLAASASLPGRRPMACVWEVATPRILHVARGDGGGLTAIDLSADESTLLLADEDGTARLYPLGGPAIEARPIGAGFAIPEGDHVSFTSARFSPADPHRVAVGTRGTGARGGQVFLWRWDERKAVPDREAVVGPMEGEVNALTFSRDGKWLSASSSRNKKIQFWDVGAPGKPRRASFTPDLHHDEQVGALAAWPVGAMVVSGGDDAAIRFWDLGEKSLIGTLVAQARTPTSVDWLAFTPDGLFDGSMPGESMLRWRIGRDVVTPQQAIDRYYRPQLTEALSQAKKPRPIEARGTGPRPELKVEGPDLKIFDPPTDRTVESREVELTLWFGDPSPGGLRLYQNGVPVKGQEDFRVGDDPHFARTRVTLRKGENRIFAMAARKGSVDGRTDELTLHYDGPEPDGRLHTLALGISAYRNRALKYAHVDARRVSDFLRRRGVQGAQEPGEQFLLLDDQVTEPNINEAFRRLRAAVKNHPEDTVVLFLAGHTDTDEVDNQFCLLLPRFPFGPDPAIGPIAQRGLAARGDGGDGGVRARVGDRDVLPYSILYRRLSGLDALKRLVIVDACQAGAILDDRAVLNIQQDFDRDMRKARNSYLLAARRGEPANEADALQHGLLTYTLLKGMGADNLKPIPEELGGFPGPPSADRDGDGRVSSDELVAYADETLPKLARMFPQVVIRSGGPAPTGAPGPSPELERRLRLRSAGPSFPLVNLPVARR